jgi:TRAP-type C4-dicarboxylate transport system permease small subunit
LFHSFHFKRELFMPLLFVALGRLCQVFGAIGAALALATGMLTTASVLMRALWSQPISGDVEMTQMGIALAIAMCLPYCQWQRANIIVDFFTQSSSPRSQGRLDALGNLFLVVLYGLLAWRTSVGAVSVYEAGETTMIIGLPMWWAYACLAPGLALAGCVALLQALTGSASAPQEATP